jgi:catechol 2,3-dioxygenase-like lactoylglutathione lyase family enzyme
MNYPFLLVALLGSIAAQASTISPLTKRIPFNLTSDPTSVDHAVWDIKSTLHFYHDLIGLVVLSEDTESVYNEAYSQLTATSGASYKTAIVQIPNQAWTLKLVEYGDIQRESIRVREQDPGAPGLTLTVKNATAINLALRAANATTVNGQPVPNGTAEGTTSTVWVYDPDGFMVELVQRSGASDYFTVPPPNITDGPGMEYVIRGQLDLTMYNYTQALTFYKDILGQNISAGFEPLIGPYQYEPVGEIGSVFNVSSNVTWTAVTGNCDPYTRCEYYEYDDPERVTIDEPAQNPGIGMTTYVVQDLDSIVSQVQAANLTIVTEGGAPVVVNGIRSILIRDPTGYLVRLDASY